MRYALVANPNSGVIPLRNRRPLLEKLARVFNEKEVLGLDTESPSELCELMRNLPEVAGYTPDVVVLCGGDGTFHHGINEIHGPALAFLPLGSGNFLRFTFGLKGSIFQMARSILTSPVHPIDLVEVRFNDTCVRSTSCSIGFEALAMSLSEGFRKRNLPSWISYGAAGPVAAPLTQSENCVLEYDQLKKSTSFISFAVQKHPYITTFGIKINPQAKLDDGLLHFVMFRDLPSLLGGYVGGKLAINSAGEIWKSKQLRLITEGDVLLQADGNYIGKGNEFRFSVLPLAARIKHSIPQEICHMNP